MAKTAEKAKKSIAIKAKKPVVGKTKAAAKKPATGKKGQQQKKRVRL